MSGDSVVIIPTYNEAQNIQRLISAIHEVWNALDIVVVDDGSPDGTADLAAAMDGVHVIRRAGKLGLGTAYVAGFRYALEQGYPRIGGMDADFSHDPLVLPALFALLGGLPFCSASALVRECRKLPGAAVAPVDGARRLEPIPGAETAPRVAGSID